MTISNVLPSSLSENREPTAEKTFWPYSLIKFVKYAQYSPHLISESDSKWLPLATASILGQATRLCAASALFTLLINSAVQAAAVIDTTTEPAATASPFILSNSDLSTGSVKAYRPWFENGAWQGDLIEYSVSTGGVLSTSVDTSVDPPTNSAGTHWSARLRFDAAEASSTYWTNTRKIITSTTGTDQTAFLWANLTSAQQTSVDSVAKAAGDTSSDILNYVRGERDNELGQTPPGTLRQRYNLLGDIVHSNPIYVGTPGASFSLAGYSDFKNNLSTDSPSGQSDRGARIYAGANDGMLHVFNAATGDEVYAYVPSMVFGNLGTLTVDAYVHTYYVDGELVSGDANFGVDDNDWHTVLAGGLGSGGKGLFVLDITNDSLTAETATTGNDDKILWEKDSTAEDDMGYIHGKPQVALLPDGKWYVITGNGYGSVNGVAKLMLYSLATASSGTLTEIATDGTTSNGLSAPALIDIDNDFVADYAYAGDLLGNLWKFDLANPGTAAVKLFTALDASSNPQPITVGPDIARHPDGGYLIYFGTGSLLSGPITANADNANTLQQSFYAIYDDGNAPVNANTLLTQTITDDVQYAAGTIVRTITDTAIVWSSKNGWKVDFPATGERLVGDPQLRAGRLQFMTTNPVNNNTWLIELDYLNGGIGDNVLFDLNGDGSRNEVDTVNRSVDGNGDLTGYGTYPIGIRYHETAVFSQPTIARISNDVDTLLTNGLLLPVPPICSGDCSDGFIGGHVDVDTDSPWGGESSGAGGDSSSHNGLSNKTDAHQHEYDKVHGAVYVDYFDLEPRRGTYSLDLDDDPAVALDEKLNRVTEVCDPDDVSSFAGCDSNTPATKLFSNVSATKTFFIVLANADLSPGGVITIGTKTWNVQDYQDMVKTKLDVLAGAAATTANLLDDDSASLVFTLDDLTDSSGTLKIDFDSRSIIDGEVHATRTGCVKGDTDPYDGNESGTYSTLTANHLHITEAQETGYTGLRWRNGALTLQLIDATDYTLQADALVENSGGTVVGGIHAKAYTVSSGTITVAQENNTAPQVESGLLYESTVFNHYGDLFQLVRTGAPVTTPCYGASNYQAALTIERKGLTLGEYQDLADYFDSASDADIATFTALLALFESDPSLANFTNLKNFLDDNNLQDYFKYRSYIRGLIPQQHLLEWDKPFVDVNSSISPAQVQDATESENQLGQDLRTGRRTWIDLTP